MKQLATSSQRIEAHADKSITYDVFTSSTLFETGSFLESIECSFEHDKQIMQMLLFNLPASA